MIDMYGERWASLRCSMNHARKANAEGTEFRRWTTFIRRNASLTRRTVA